MLNILIWGSHDLINVPDYILYHRIIWEHNRLRPAQNWDTFWPRYYSTHALFLPLPSYPCLFSSPFSLLSSLHLTSSHLSIGIHCTFAVPHSQWHLTLCTHWQSPNRLFPSLDFMPLLVLLFISMKTYTLHYFALSVLSLNTYSSTPQNIR